MDNNIEPQNFIQILLERSQDSLRGPADCQRLLTILNHNLTEEQLSSSLVDLYILHIFDRTNGLFKFILGASSNRKLDNASVNALEIIYTLINNFERKVEEHILDINEKCLRILQNDSSAKVKGKAADVLIVGFEKVDKCLENQEKYSALFEGLKTCLIQAIHTGSVRLKEFIAVGLFMRKFSYLVTNPIPIKKYFVVQLDNQMIRGMSQSIICGIFTGMAHLCESFPFSLDNQEDVPIIQKIYKYVWVLSKIDNGQHFGNRAAMAYFGSNMNLFVKMVTKRYKEWHERLLTHWLNKGVEDKKVAEKTIKALLLHLAETLLEMNKEESMPILNYFIGWFKTTIKQPTASNTEKKLCIQGLRYFSSPLYKFFTKEDAQEVFLLIMRNFEKLYILRAQVDKEEMEFMADYIQCLTSFMRYQKLTNSEIYCLQRSTISIIKTFHQLKPLHHSAAIDAIITSLFYLKETEHFDAFLEIIVYQGVVWSCSHRHIADSDLANEQGTIVTVKNYFPLWHGLLKLVGNRFYDKVSIYLEDRKFILTKIVNELVKTLMILINKLNVKVKLKEDAVQTNIETAYQVEQSNDFAIFLNITDFYQEIFDNIDPTILKYCICKMISHIVAKCLQYPLVSGFYKLLSMALKISNNLKLFDKDNITLNQDVINCKETLSKFLTFLLHKMKQFKDELLISCLQVLMECPVIIVEPLLSDCVGIFITVFEIGRSYIALANMGLSTLQRWQQYMNKNKLEAFLLQVVPTLDSYLRSKSLGGLTQTTNIDKKRKAAQGLKKRSVLIELEPELVKFQRRVLHFVGSQSSKVCQMLVSPDSNFERKVTSDNLHLKVMLPYNDMTLEVHLEPFIMRVVELCQNSSDRKTRVMACEVLQAFMMVFLGRTKSMPHSSLSDLDELLKSIAMPLLQLACDIDQVVRQIFEPLFMQLTHWYTSKIQKESPHLAVIIEVLMEGVTHPTNSSLRDFSGQCIKEFVKWTIKQSSERELKSDPINIKILVRRIRFFGGHSDFMKKMGAALIFNNIYKEIREERALISIFAMELLHIFICSLALLKYSNEEVENTVLQITNAIGHLGRIFVEKHQIFREPDEQRRVPSDISEGNLEGLSKWLLSMTASRSKYCRDVSIELFVHLQPLCGTKESLSLFAGKCCDNLVALYKKELEKQPTLEHVDLTGDCTALLNWLQALLCQTDGFIFIISNNLTAIDFADTGDLESILYFLKSVQTVNIEQGLKLICKNSAVPYYTVCCKEEFVNLKSLCCLAILKLANAVLGVEVLCKKSNLLWNRPLWNLVLNFIFNPTSLGLDARVSQPEFLEVLMLFLNTVRRKLSEAQVDELVGVLRSYVSNHFKVDFDLRRNVNLKQRNILKGLLMIQASQLNSLFKAEDFSACLVDRLLYNFMNQVEDNVVSIGTLTEITTEYCSLVLKFVLNNVNEFDALLSYLYKDIFVCSQEIPDVDNEMLFGVYFLTKFSDPLVKFVADRFDRFVRVSDNIEVMVRLTSCLLKHLEKNRGPGNSVVHGITTKWYLFEQYFETNNIDLGLDFVRQYWRVYGNDFPSDMGRWVLRLLGEESLISAQEGPNLYLNIFSVVAEVLVDDNTDILSNALERLRTILVPMIFDDPENSTLTEKLLLTLPTVKSPTVFKFLIDFYITYTPSGKSYEGLTDLLNNFMSNAAKSVQQNILQAVFLMAIDKEKSFEQKKALTENVLPYVFKNGKSGVVEKFFVDNITEIVARLEDVSDYGNGMVYFSLIEMMFFLIPMNVDQKEHCAITEAYRNSRLPRQLLRVAFDVFTNNNGGESTEQLRLFKCSAYKAQASIITNSVSSEGFYNKLFIREENRKDILWNALIDTNLTYSFPIDFDSYPKKRKTLISIREELRHQVQENKTKSLRYLESQRLFNSSLSEDVTKFDFTNSILRTHPPSGRINEDEEVDNAEQHLEARFNQGEIYLEATEINNHELMGTVCGIIEHIFTSGICRLPEDPEEMVELPNWMQGIRNLLGDGRTHKNVKIFWVKVIDNMSHIFRYFAKEFFMPLLQFLVGKYAGSNLNYFVSDVIVLLASWARLVPLGEDETSEEALLASFFLKDLVDNLTNQRQDAFKYNMDLVKLFVENWKGRVGFPYEGIFAKLSFDPNDRQIEVGIHLASILLVNDILPCQQQHVHEFWNKLTEILSSSISTVYKPCAETVGMMLKYFKMHEMTEVSLEADIRKLSLKFDINGYAGRLEGVAIHYPEIVDEFHIIKMLNRLPQSDQNLQRTFLKIVFKRTDILGDIYSFKAEDWVKYLESQDADIQLTTLEIILKTFPALKGEKSFKEIIKSVSKNLSNPNSFCRGRMHDIMMAILEHGDIKEGEIIELCKEVLIQGIVDHDVEIREKVMRFWSESPLVPLDISKKFPYLMSNFYLPKMEEHFLGYASYYLLESIKPHEYEKELFEHPLENCNFEEYKLQTNWRLQHPSVVPMFAETLRSYSESSDDVSPENFGALRATQHDLTFAPTQQSVKERYISQITGLESTAIGASVGTSRLSTSSFLNPNTMELSQKYKLPKKRFLKDKTKISADFANRAVTQRVQKHVKRYDAVKEQEKRVTIYRSYRKGDFPDVQITLGSLVKPLQMLVLHDGELSKIFFSVIYKTLKTKLTNIQDDFTNAISKSIKFIFTSSVQYNANVFSTLLDILLMSKREFRADPGLISSVCQQSGLISMGTLLIEEYLTSFEDVPSSSKRGNCSSDDSETRHWLKLAELYKELHEYDLVRTIFLEKSNCKEQVHKAIKLESKKRWREAQEMYEKLINEDLFLERHDFYCESYFKILAHLGEWEKVPKVVEDIVPNNGEHTWNSLWDNDWFQQKILPWYMSAKVKNILFTGQDCPQFLTDINKSLSNPEQVEYLKNKFSEELCILWLTQKDTAQAKQYLNSSLDAFLNEWQLLNPMFENLRYNKVLSLRTLVEIHRFIETEKNLTEESGEEHLNSLQEYWKSTQKEFLPSIVLSEAKLLYRKLFSKLLIEKLTGLNQLEPAKELKKTKIMLDISFMNLAVEERNFYMTRKYFREFATNNHPSLAMIQGSLGLLGGDLVQNNPELKLSKLLEAVKKFREVVKSTEDERVITSLMRIFEISEKVTDVLSDNTELYAKFENILLDIFGSETDSPLEVASQCLKAEALKETSDSHRAGSNVIEVKAKALVKLAYYVQDQPDQEQDFVLMVLRAIQMSSKEARQLFPCILLKDSLGDELKELFIAETEKIPTWMFLGWIPQLLANVDSPKVDAISEIILRIARTYPQAIMYSYRLSKVNYSGTDNLCLEGTKLLTDELDRLLLSDPVVDKFLEALSKVSVPLVTLLHHLKTMVSSQTMETIMKIKDEVCGFFFSENPDFRDSSGMQGNMYKIVKNFKSDFQKMNDRLAVDEIQKMARAIGARIQAILSPAPPQKAPANSKMLKDYCPWLANFSAGRMNLELEIPGQYSGEKMPLVQHHIKISGFRDTVSVMSSLRQPIKVTMLGMDSKEYPFLIKFGEDIRQDQRIQQLFVLMNNIFASVNKSHHLLTYQVIPLTSSLGIIHWIEHTVSLGDFIRRALPAKRNKDVFEIVRNKYDQFLEGTIKDLNVDRYGRTALKKDRNRVIPFYNGLVYEIPWDILRTSIWSISLTTESFIAFRDNFIKSYAAVCVCHWILGIGDRHLQNTKVCTKTGKVLGIDFGHAFGTATQILSVPELVPIRLTPHIVSLMEPFKEKGMFRDVMIDCLRSLRENRVALLATMNVFILEPSVDWLENARQFEMHDQSDIAVWYPLQKIEQARRKLQGASSTVILVEDLKSSVYYVKKPQYFKAYVSLVEGDEQCNDFRTRLSHKESLSVEEQVDVLIDHATDRNLLGRMFAGWSPAV